MNFSGFTFPEGAWLPPELIYLLPYLKGGQLKCTIAAIYHYMQVGGSESLSLSDFQRLTGMARSSVSATIQELTEGRIQTIERQACGNTYLYIPKLKLFATATAENGAIFVLPGNANGRKILPPGTPDSTKIEPPTAENGAIFVPPGEGKGEESDKLINLTDSTDSLNSLVGLLNDLRAAGIYLKTAQELMERHSEEKIRQHMLYYQYALRMNIAQGPGYLVTSIKENWGPPLGYKAPRENPYYSAGGNDESGEEISFQEAEEFDNPAYDIPVPGTAHTAGQAWHMAKGQLQMDMPKAAFDTWVAPADLAEYEPETNTFTIRSQNKYASSWLSGRVDATLAMMLTGITNRQADVVYWPDDEVCAQTSQEEPQ